MAVDPFVDAVVVGLTGMHVPEAQAPAVRMKVEDPHRRLAASLRELQDLIAEVSGRVTGSAAGPWSRAYAAAMATFASDDGTDHIEALRQTALKLADYAGEYAYQLDYTVRMIIAQVFQFLAEWALTLVLALWNPVGALIEQAFLRALYRVVLRSWILRLLATIAAHEVLNVGLSTAMDGLVRWSLALRGIHTAKGAEYARAAAQMGAIQGALGWLVAPFAQAMSAGFGKWLSRSTIAAIARDIREAMPATARDTTTATAHLPATAPGVRDAGPPGEAVAARPGTAPDTGAVPAHRADPTGPGGGAASDSPARAADKDFATRLAQVSVAVAHAFENGGIPHAERQVFQEHTSQLFARHLGDPLGTGTARETGNRWAEALLTHYGRPELADALGRQLPVALPPGLRRALSQGVADPLRAGWGHKAASFLAEAAANAAHQNLVEGFYNYFTSGKFTTSAATGVAGAVGGLLSHLLARNARHLAGRFKNWSAVPPPLPAGHPVNSTSGGTTGGTGNRRGTAGTPWPSPRALAAGLRSALSGGYGSVPASDPERMPLLSRSDTGSTSRYDRSTASLAGDRSAAPAQGADHAGPLQPPAPAAPAEHRTAGTGPLVPAATRPPTTSTGTAPGSHRDTHGTPHAAHRDTAPSSSARSTSDLGVDSTPAHPGRSGTAGGPVGAGVPTTRPAPGSSGDARETRGGTSGFGGKEAPPSEPRPGSRPEVFRPPAPAEPTKAGSAWPRHTDRHDTGETPPLHSSRPRSSGPVQHAAPTAGSTAAPPVAFRPGTADTEADAYASTAHGSADADILRVMRGDDRPGRPVGEPGEAPTPHDTGRTGEQTPKRQTAQGQPTARPAPPPHMGDGRRSDAGEPEGRISRPGTVGEVTFDGTVTRPRLGTAEGVAQSATEVPHPEVHLAERVLAILAEAVRARTGAAEHLALLSRRWDNGQGGSSSSSPSTIDAARARLAESEDAVHAAEAAVRELGIDLDSLRIGDDDPRARPGLPGGAFGTHRGATASAGPSGAPRDLESGPDTAATRWQPPPTETSDAQRNRYT
ncbi:hypothetical protein ABZV75_37395 [Streptomyces flaveolus]|uniref:hypothetical protein n=1 Tax=Streptomyces flaveolus TaxID=67297 RepID=UPI0033B83D46